MAKKLFPLSDKQMNYLIYGIAAAIVIWLLWKFVIAPKLEEGTEETASEETATGSTTKQPAAAYTDATVFSKKSPLMKDKRVQWIQNTYNNYAKERKQYGKTPDWPAISTDGVYGSNTAAAVNRVMGKTSTSWTEFKARIDYFRKQNVQAGIGTPEPQTDQYGYNWGYFN